MASSNKLNLISLACACATCAILIVCLTFAGNLTLAENAPWNAPANAKALKNPVATTTDNIAAAKKLYQDDCATCHGDGGAGDGIAGQYLSTKPASFADPKVMAGETDGSLFWKISEGRGAMPPWKGTLSDKQRWQMVDYIRTFAHKPAPSKH